jgi:uncharacterized membrane protein YfcA
MGFMNWVRVQWDRAAALAAMIIGLLALLLGWIGVSGQAYVAKQLPYIISGALFGIFMIGVAAVLWLSADLRDEWRELRGIRLELRDQRVSKSVSAQLIHADMDQTSEISSLSNSERPLPRERA